MKRVFLEQNTAEWLAWRKTKRSASSTPAVMNVGYHSAATEAYLRYGGGKIDISNVPAVRAGVQNEAKIRERVNKELHKNYQPACFENGPWAASLDGWDDGILEIKYSQTGLEQAKKQNALAVYYWQIQHQMLVTEAPSALLVCAFEDELAYLTIERSEDAINAIKLKWEEFERQYANLYEFEFLKLCEDYAKAETEFKAAQAKKERLAGLLKAKNLSFLSDTSFGRVSLSISERAHINYKAMALRAALKPEEIDISYSKINTLRLNKGDE